MHDQMGIFPTFGWVF